MTTAHNAEDFCTVRESGGSNENAQVSCKMLASSAWPTRLVTASPHLSHLTNRAGDEDSMWQRVKFSFILAISHVLIAPSAGKHP